jgi:hypothetical protein
MNAARRAAIVIYGNCQAEFMGLLLSRTPSIAARFDVAVASNNVDAGAALSAIAPYADRTVLYWEQLDVRPEIPVRDAVRRALRSDRTTVLYPALSMIGFWPFFVKDARNQPEPGFPYGRYPAGDRVAIEVAGMGLAENDAFDCYMEMSRQKMPDVRMLIARDLDMQARRDAACDVKMCDFVSENLRSAYQFWTRGHLATCVLAELLLRLLEKSRSVIATLDNELSELQAVYEQFPGQGDFQHPIHPLVIEQLDLEFVNASTTYNWLGQSWTFEQHMKRYLAFDRTW